jgi:hypothetical protein
MFSPTTEVAGVPPCDRLRIPVFCIFEVESFGKMPAFSIAIILKCRQLRHKLSDYVVWTKKMSCGLGGLVARWDTGDSTWMVFGRPCPSGVRIT